MGAETARQSNIGAVERYDAVIVGARCGGSPLAIELARGGWDVLLIDRDEFPSDTISTHFFFPNTFARLEALGVLETLEAAHELHPVGHRVRILGHEIAGRFTPIAGFDGAAGPRRLVLDQAMVTTALAAGAEGRFGERVRGLVGAGTEDDPVRGVVTEGGGEIEARWVIGADGRASSVASALGLEKANPGAGEMGVLYAYYRGIPATDYMHLDASEDEVLTWGPCEDDVSNLMWNVRPDVTRGNADSRERRFEEAIRRFPHSLDPEWLEDAERISEVRVAPETMLRGFFRRAAGPGWALVGDANHFKHPATAQGISDAVEQAHYVAEGLLGADPELEGYEAWLDQRAAEHYEFSFQFATFPRPETAHALFGGLERDERAAQDFRDVMSRRVRPQSGVFTRERLERWFAAAEATRR